MNVFSVAFPLKVGVALLVVAASLPFLGGWISDQMYSSVATALHALSDPMADPDKTEKATPKRRGEARKKGNVAKSTDLNGAVVLAAGLVGLMLHGPEGDRRRQRRHAHDLRPDLPSGRGHHRVRAARADAARPAHDADHGGADRRHVHVRRGAGQRRPGRLQADLRAAQAELQQAQPGQRLQERVLQPRMPFEGAKALAKVSAVGAVVAMALVPAAHPPRRERRHAARRLGIADQLERDRHRRARGDRLPADRDRST